MTRLPSSPYQTGKTPSPRLGKTNIWAILAVISAAGIGTIALQNWMAERRLNQGESAYQQADCAEAIAHFDRVIHSLRILDWEGYESRATTLRAECQVFQVLKAAEATGDTITALQQTETLVTIYPNSLLIPVARQETVALLDPQDPITLVQPAVCDRLMSLIQKELVPTTDSFLPPLNYACAQHLTTTQQQGIAATLYQHILTHYPDHALADEAQTGFIQATFVATQQTVASGGNYEQAIARYRDILAQFPDHPLIPDVKAALGEALIAQVDASTTGAGSIPQPEVSGYAAYGSSVVVIQNDSPERMQIVFSGPETRYEELEPCTHCQSYTDTGSEFCPELGPVGVYTLPPGTCDVMVSSVSGAGVTPFRGQWSLVDGSEYSNGFFVVTSLRF